MKELSRAIITIAITLAIGAAVVPMECYQTAPAATAQVTAQAPAPVTAPAEPNYVIMDVSAYCLCAKCCGIWAEKGKVNGIRVTASGVPAVGRICAAPRRYPFGTVFEVQGVGSYVCEDRGGAIKGNKLDLLFEDKGDVSGHQRALNFGRDKQAKVRIYYAK